MASRNRQYLTIRDLRGGMNDTDPPTLLADNECVEAVNVDWQEGGIGHRRRGSEVYDVPGHPFTTDLATLYRHVSNFTQTKAELWGFDFEGHVARLSNGAFWTEFAVPDPIEEAQHVCCCTFNGLLYIAYNSGVDRLHVAGDFSPVFGPGIARVGLIAPGIPTIGAKSAGAVTDTRTYKVGWRSEPFVGVVKHSELSLPSTPATVLAAQQVIVNRPALPVAAELVTHWDLYVASTDGVYYGPIASAPAVTASLVDNNAVINTFPVAPLIGANLPPPSAKYLITDGNRLLMAGAWEIDPPGEQSFGLSSRVWYTPVLGTTGGNADRIPQIPGVQNNYLDLTEKDGESILGLGQLLGMVYVFKQRQIWKLVPTGIDTAPYHVVQVSRDIGTISHKSICVAEDADGNPSLYFLSHRGPYRIGSTGLEFLGWKIRALWDRVNLNATEQFSTGLHYSAKDELWWFVAIDGSNSPNCRILYDTLDGGFAINYYPNRDPVGMASCQFSNVPGVVNSRDLKPYFSLNKGEPVILKGDTGTRDYGEKYQGFITTKPYVLESILRESTAWEGRLLAKASPEAIQLTLIRDFGLEIHEEMIDLTPQLTETHVIRKFEASYLSGNRALQVTLGDQGNVDAEWTLDELVLPVQAHQED